MESWQQKIAADPQKARSELLELNRQVTRYSARVEGLKGHVGNLYLEMQAFREDTSALAQQTNTATLSLLAAFESLDAVTSLFKSVLRQVDSLKVEVDDLRTLKARVEALEKKQDAA